ncbi:MAG TPA: dihydrofolate reductase family protein [Myxococcales bacterium]
MNMTEAASMFPEGQPLQMLFERPATDGFGIPVPLASCYGGDLGFNAPCLYANFVASVDGVAALPTSAESGGIVSGYNQADRFVMGLLRACAEAVVVGAGTFRKTPKHLWHASHVYPPAAPFFAELREQRGLSREPLLVLVSGSGELDPAHLAFQHPTLVITTPEGEARSKPALPKTVRFAPVPSNPISAAAIVDILRAEGLRIVLTEGGPSLVGDLLAQSALDQLFLTVSPKLLGRSHADGRKAITDGVDLFGAKKGEMELLSVRRHHDHLFLRYAVRAAQTVSAVR